MCLAKNQTNDLRSRVPLCLPLTDFKNGASQIETSLNELGAEFYSIPMQASVMPNCSRQVDFSTLCRNHLVRIVYCVCLAHFLLAVRGTLS